MIGSQQDALGMYSNQRSCNSSLTLCTVDDVGIYGQSKLSVSAGPMIIVVGVQIASYSRCIMALTAVG